MVFTIQKSHKKGTSQAKTLSWTHNHNNTFCKMIFAAIQILFFPFKISLFMNVWILKLSFNFKIKFSQHVLAVTSKFGSHCFSLQNVSCAASDWLLFFWFALGYTHTRQSVPCLSTFDSQSPVCLTNVSTAFHTQARHALLALARLEEVGFSTVQMHMHKHKHGAPTSLWLFVEDSP